GEEGDELAIEEGGRDHGDVVEVPGALPRIVGDVGVALRHLLAGDLPDEVEHRLRHRIDMARRAGHRLSQHLALRREATGREVARLAYGGREGGAEQRHRLLLDDGDEAVPHHLQTDIGNVGHRCAPLRTRRIEPSSWITASKVEVTTVVVSRSRMSAGPTMRAPAASPGRSWMAEGSMAPPPGSKTGRVPAAVAGSPSSLSLWRSGSPCRSCIFTDQVTTTISRSSRPSIARPKKRV